MHAVWLAFNPTRSQDPVRRASEGDGEDSAAVVMVANETEIRVRLDDDPKGNDMLMTMECGALPVWLRAPEGEER